MSFFEIFQPGLRHLREERDRLKTLVSRPKHGGEGPLGIDLDGGKATFTMPVTSDTRSGSAADGTARATEEPAVVSWEDPDEGPARNDPDEGPARDDPDEGPVRDDPAEPPSAATQPPA